VNEQAVDIWEAWATGRWAVIPTNCQTRPDGRAVMGAGLAKAAAARFSGIDRSYGRAIARGEVNLALPAHRLLLAPTKDHWSDPSSLDLVASSCHAVAAYAFRRNVSLVVPKLGCGLGGLDWADVGPVVDDAFACVDYVIAAPVGTAHGPPT